jgi:type 1 fimbriae regulatory protein FimB/type 1 fimbriae regulatory protein FimE
MTVIQFPVGGRRFLKAKKSDSPPQKTSRNSRTYVEVRDREYLFEEEVEAMVKAAFKGRWGHRDSTLILMGYRHGLRISELVNLRWQQINFNTGHIHVRRLKGSRPSVHPLSGEEIRALRQLQRDYPDHPTYLSRRGATR